MLLLLVAVLIGSSRGGSLYQLFAGSSDEEDEEVLAASSIDQQTGDAGPPKEYIEGVRANFWNNVTRKQFTTGAFRKKRPSVAGHMLRDVSFRFFQQESFPGVYREEFAAIFTGYLLPPRSGVYKIDVEGDDLATLFLGSDRCLNKATQHPSCAISLIANKRIAFELRYFQDVGPAMAVLSWECMPHFHRMIVPPSAFRALKVDPQALEDAAVAAAEGERKAEL